MLLLQYFYHLNRNKFTSLIFRHDKTIFCHDEIYYYFFNFYYVYLFFENFNYFFFTCATLILFHFYFLLALLAKH